jgi:hypothetical protein
MLQPKCRIAGQHMRMRAPDGRTLKRDRQRPPGCSIDIDRAGSRTRHLRPDLIQRR